MDWFPAVLSLRQIFVNFGVSCAIVGSSYTILLAKKSCQNCLTVSNIKLDDVFSDVFGKTASAITDRLLESNEPFDVAPYLNKRIKTPAEKIQAAVDGELCVEQAEKLRIIRSHMNSLELCKANLESLILSTA